MIVSKLIKLATAGLLAPVLFFASAPIPAGASPKVSVLAFGLFGAQSVFESEAKGAAGIVAHQLARIMQRFDRYAARSAAFG
jgi:hypothetical protein